MNQPLRVAVIGGGHMGRHHVRVYSQLPQCQLVAVVDKDLERARTLAEQHGGIAVTRLADVPGKLDAVSVAVPTVYHAEVVVPLLEQGVSVLVEKPLAPDVASARRLLEAARSSSAVLQVGHSERFNPVVQALLRLGVQARFVEAHRISPFTFRSADVSVVFDMMIHDIDIVLHLAQEREYTVDAVGVNVLGSCDDVANARVRFANGVVANLTASRLALKTERKIRVFCPTAYVSMDYQKKSGVAIKLDANLDLVKMARERDFEDLSQMAHLDFGSMVKVEPLQIEDVEPLRAEIEAFLTSVQRGGAGAASAEEGFAAVEMAERITTAIRAEGWSTPLA
ncbi:MAG TPA: Gfo/Idh/MocA family oxidoreductase [Phycisphaerae bacterium]|nr:Gfo/Idh/MocA family oxidoreductase [Phycisphaerae bacterium]HNU46709.1 Gfo/Idh/MocA family oxidoreductase [Phycisphaerae bacterium]